MREYFEQRQREREAKRNLRGMNASRDTKGGKRLRGREHES